MAIAFDAASTGDNGGSTTSLTVSHTCTGSNLILFVGFLGDVVAGANDITGVTYNSVALTALYTGQTAGSGRFYYLYYLIGPATGANNIVISCTGTHYLLAANGSWTGAVGGIDVHNVNSGTTNITTTVTTTVDNDWLVGFCASTLGGQAADVTNCSLRGLGAFGAAGIYDSGPQNGGLGNITPAGSANLHVTDTGAAGLIVVAIAPTAPAATGWGGLLDSQRNRLVQS